MSTDRLLFLNLLSAASRLFCDICPCSGTAATPRLRSSSAARSAPAHVATNTMNELPDISFNMCTRYTSWKLNRFYLKRNNLPQIVLLKKDFLIHPTNIVCIKVFLFGCLINLIAQKRQNGFGWNLIRTKVEESAGCEDRDKAFPLVVSRLTMNQILFTGLFRLMIGKCPSF